MGSTWTVNGGADTLVTDTGDTMILNVGPLLSDATLELLDASIGAGHRDGSAQVVYVFKVSPMSVITAAIEDQYFASTTFRTDAADTPANTPMLGRLTPPNIRVSILKSNQIGNSTSVTRGTIKVENPREQHFDRNTLLTDGRGRYDHMRKEFSWQGRTGLMFIGPEDGQFATEFDAFFPCLIKDFDWSEERILFVPGAALVEDDDVVQKNYYGQGYVVLSGGAIISDSHKTDQKDQEKTITVFDDLSGVPQPLAYGRLFGVLAQEISSANEIHQFHVAQSNTIGSTVQSLDAVYEDGLQMTAGADYAENLSDATYQLISESTAAITCDVHGALAGPTGTYIDRPGAIIRAVLLDQVGLEIADIATETLDLYDAAFDYECGYYFGAEPITRKTFLDEMLAPLGFAFRSRDGRFRIGYVKHPADETPDLQLLERDVLSVTRKATLRPVWRVRIGYAPIHTPLTLNSFAGAVTEAEIARQSNEYRWVEAKDEGILGLHAATELEIKTRFTDQADAQALADEVLRLYGRPRDILEVRLAQKYLRYDIGDIVQLGWPRYEIVDDGVILQENGDKILLETSDDLLREEDPDGSYYMAVGYVDNPAASEFSVTVWG